MVTLLLIVIYIAFIGLGIPDSLFGTAWPAIYKDFNVSVSYGGLITLIITLGTVLSSIFSSRLINKCGTGLVTAFSTFLTAISLLGFSFSSNILWICLCSLPLGIGAGAIDSGLNNYVALHYKAVHMNFLHCFYGIGVSLSPYLMSLALSDNNQWRIGYRTVFFIQLLITLVVFLSLPMWKRVGEQKESQHSCLEAKTLKMSEMIKMPLVKAVWLIFFCACGIEFTFGTWGSVFLIDTKGIKPDFAAKIVTFYYIGISVGRFLSGILSRKLSGRTLIYCGQTIIIISVLMLILPLSPIITGLFLFLIGLGIGPVFPNLIYLTPINFGEDISQSIMGSQMAAAYIGVMTIPSVFGLIADNLGANFLPFYVILLFVIMICATKALFKPGKGIKY